MSYRYINYTNMSYIINNNSFKTKAEITDYFSKMLNSREVGIPLDGDDFNDIHELLKYHIKYHDKIGCGLESISIEYHQDNLTYKNAKFPHFQINRVDGTYIDFSFYKAVKHINKKTTVNGDNIIEIKKAMRFIVKGQINEYRDSVFEFKTYLKCPILNINFSRKTCHIDHNPPKSFDVLIFNFLNENNIKFRNIELLDINGIFRTFKDNDLKNRWFNYHKLNADLRPTHQAGNLSQKKVKINWDSIK